MPSQYIYVNPNEIGLNELPKDQWDDGVQEDILQRLTSYVKTAKRGDTISLKTSGNSYRNDWTYLWDGKKAVELDRDFDEYGAVPRSFKVTDREFSPDWWSFSHNTIFWLSDEIKSRMVFEKKDGQIFADFLIGNTMWRCYVDNPEEVDTLEDLGTQDTYFELCESECSVRSSLHRPHVMYLYFTYDDC